MEESDLNKNKELIYSLDYTGLGQDAQVELLSLLNQYNESLKYKNRSVTFSKTGPFRQDLYLDAMAFFKAGSTFKERFLSGGNRSGKSTAGCYETACHADGDYPEWWEGKTFLAGEDIKILVMGNTAQSTRDISQTYLLGDIYDIGTGMIPKERILKDTIRMQSGVSGAIESVQVKRVDGGRATLLFRSYAQDTKGIAGLTINVVHCDEPPSNVTFYAETQARTISTGGIIYITATPDIGVGTDVVSLFLVGGLPPKNNIVPPTRDNPHVSRWIRTISVLDVPHNTDEEKKGFISSIPKYLHGPKIYGLPGAGSGRIYQTPEEDISVAPFEIPYDWPQGFGMDFALSTGYTAVVWFTHDVQKDILYITNVYKVSGLRATNNDHIAAIRKQGAWIPGVIDKSASKMKENQTWLQFYQEAGLEVSLADNAVEPGIARIIKRLENGTLKVVFTCTPWFEEYRQYHWDLSGKVARDQQDHLMDATRYFELSGIPRMISLKEVDEEANYYENMNKAIASSSKNLITGY